MSFTNVKQRAKIDLDRRLARPRARPSAQPCLYLRARPSVRRRKPYPLRRANSQFRPTARRLPTVPAGQVGPTSNLFAKFLVKSYSRQLSDKVTALLSRAFSWYRSWRFLRVGRVYSVDTRMNGRRRWQLRHRLTPTWASSAMHWHSWHSLGVAFLAIDRTITSTNCFCVSGRLSSHWRALETTAVHLMSSIHYAHLCNCHVD